MIRKVVITGPESTGKSSLCEQLAAHYHSLWCPEYAREYLTAHGPQYDYQDLLTIAKGQVELEETYLRMAEAHQKKKADTGEVAQSGCLFIDTDMYVMKVWCEVAYGKVHPFILEQIATRKYDLYLLCENDLEWKEDPMREYPDPAARKELYERYRDILTHQPVPWENINGIGAERLRGAIRAVEALRHQ